MRVTQKSAQRQQGVSLVELMVAMALGLWAAGVALQMALRSAQSQAVQAAYAEMNDNAQVALQLLSRELQLAGYASVKGVSAPASAGTGRLLRSHTHTPVYGCDTGFVSPLAVDVQCAAAGDSAALALSYEADTRNTSPTSADLPADCLGNAVTTMGDVYLTQHRYFVMTGNTGRPGLYCATPSHGATGQPLVDNVEHINLRFGESLAADPGRAVRYVGASQVTDWGRVVAVRLCLLMRSSESVFTVEDPASYVDCQGVLQTGAGLARQSYVTTVYLRNKTY